MQISDLKVIQGVKIEYLSNEQISRIITSSMFLKEKFTAGGSFEKREATYKIDIYMTTGVHPYYPLAAYLYFQQLHLEHSSRHCEHPCTLLQLYLRW